MLHPLTAEEQGLFRDTIAPSLRGAVREAAGIDDPAELELYAAELIPAAVAAVPGVIEETVALIEATPGGEALLRAMAAAAPPAVAERARAVTARLEPQAGSSDAVGALVPERAWELDADEPVTSITVTCRRPGCAGVQIFSCTIEWPHTGGALKDALLTTTVAESEVDPLILDRARELGVEPDETDPYVAVGMVAGAVRRCAESGVGPPPDAYPALALLLRGAGASDAEELLGALAGLPVLADEVPAEEDVSAAVDALVDEFAAWYGAQEPGERAVDLARYVACTMADYRAWYADSRLAAWNAADLEDYLLGWVPRKVGIEEDDVASVPAAVSEVLRFLGESGRLDRRQAEALARRALTLGPRFERAARDPRNFGLAKSMTAAITADGVDVADQDAVQAWIARFNGLAEEERERRVPALAQLSVPSPVRGAARRKKPAAKARKAGRQARRRNRRG